MSYTNKSASFTTSRSKDRAVFANTVLARQAIINGTNTINTKSVFGSPVGASLVLDQLVGSTETTPVEYNSYVTSVPTLPYVQGPQYYFILDNTNTLVGYTGILPAILTIPTSVNSRPVLAIGDGVFAGASALVNVIINSGGAYTSLPNNLFNGCVNLATVTITGITSIGDNIFQGCTSLTSVTLPAGLTSLATNVFQECTSLSTITLPSSLTSIGSGAFNYCTALTSITIPALITSLPDACFGNCISLATVSLPSGLVYIGNFTFAGCTGLRTIAIPTSVYLINSYGFNRSGLLSITFGSLTPPAFGSGGYFYTETYTFSGVSNSAVMYIPNAANNATWVGAVTGNNVGWTGTVVNLP